MNIEFDNQCLPNLATHINSKKSVKLNFTDFFYPVETKENIKPILEFYKKTG